MFYVLQQSHKCYTQKYNTSLFDLLSVLCLFAADKRVSRTPRRSQQPKTLDSPEDSTYYNLIHVSRPNMIVFISFNTSKFTTIVMCG